MEQSYDSPPNSNVSDEAKDTLAIAASEFRKNIQEATGKLVNAAEQFSVMSTGLGNAVDEVKAASARAQEAQKAAEEAKNGAEAVQAKMDRDYSNLKGLMSDLQERIGALAVLARPFSMDLESEAPIAAPDDTATENSLDSAAEDSLASGEDAAPATENAPSPSGWQGWRG